MLHRAVDGAVRIACRTGDEGGAGDDHRISQRNGDPAAGSGGDVGRIEKTVDPFVVRILIGKLDPREDRMADPAGFDFPDKVRLRDEGGAFGGVAIGFDQDRGGSRGAGNATCREHILIDLVIVAIECMHAELQVLGEACLPPEGGDMRLEIGLVDAANAEKGIAEAAHRAGRVLQGACKCRGNAAIDDALIFDIFISELELDAAAQFGPDHRIDRIAFP